MMLSAFLIKKPIKIPLNNTKYIYFFFMVAYYHITNTIKKWPSIKKKPLAFNPQVKLSM